MCITRTMFSPQEIPFLSSAKAPLVYYSTENGKRSSFKLYSSKISTNNQRYSNFFKTILREHTQDKSHIINDKFGVNISIEYDKPFLKLEGIRDFKKIICINPYGSSPRTTQMSIQTIKNILKIINLELPEFSIVIISPPDKRSELENELPKDVIIPNYIQKIEHSLAIIKRSALLITPDTFSVHAASNYQIPQIAIYPDKNDELFAGWEPNSTLAQTIRIPRVINEIDLNEMERCIKKFKQST